jgi:peptide/nickel transport system substrate-binding protein
MKGIDAPHYDGHAPPGDRPPTSSTCSRTRWWRSDWDGRTPIPYLAKSWDISEDGKTYTFKLRDDVTFCSGKKFTAEDVIYSFKRLKDPAIKGPYAWRAGTSRNCARPIPTRCSTSSRSPISELLLQLTMFTNAIHNKESVEALGKDYGIKGDRRHRAWCFDSWQPRTEIVLKRHDAYKWGPSMYKNKGPVKFEKLVIKIVPEDSSRVAAMMAGQFDITHQFPAQFISQAKAAPMLT